MTKRVYMVGGTVRDRLLGIKARDRDWLITGVDEAWMQANGYRRVGKDFPVFLHPKTGEQTALPRPAPLELDVPVDCPDPDLYDDLAARDFTINAMALDQNEQLIDPFGGRTDLEARLLRHVSTAFADDPLRIMRAARFMARYASLDFRITDDTQALMTALAPRLAELPAERLFDEIRRALLEPQPSVFFRTLRQCGALGVILPEVNTLFGVPQSAKYHPEIDTGEHTLMALDQARRLTRQEAAIFAVLLHDLGKALSPAERLPSHHGHEEKGAKLVDAVCRRLRAPTDWRKLAINVCRYHTHCHRAGELRPATRLKVLQALDAFRNPQNLQAFLIACEADARGRTGFEEAPYPQAGVFRAALKAAKGIDIGPLLEAGLTGEKLAEQVERLRIQAIAQTG